MTREIEQLTNHDRYWLEDCHIEAAAKALRIIDEQAKQLSAANEALEHARYWADRWRNEENHQDSGDWYMSKVDAALSNSAQASTAPESKAVTK